MDEVLEDGVTALGTPASHVQDVSVDQDRAVILAGYHWGHRGRERARAMTNTGGAGQTPLRKGDGVLTAG